LRVFIDTNVLVSASMDRAGTPRLALTKAVTPPNQAIVCDQNLDELRRVYYRKFSNKLDALQDFLDYALASLDVVKVPPDPLEIEARVRDDKDRTILRSAIMEKVDVIVTGDKDLLESGITMPIIVTPAEFVKGIDDRLAKTRRMVARGLLT